MVVVFGSINLDLVAQVARIPGPGETLAGWSFMTLPGGKGANQALAAARAGAKVALFGAVGAMHLPRPRSRIWKHRALLCRASPPLTWRPG